MALNISPGPSILYILSRCLGQGRSAGVVSVFGLATASVIHAATMALGLSTLLLYSPVAFGVLKYLGALYLSYLGIRGLLLGSPFGVAAVTRDGPKPSLWAVYRQGVLTDLLNPKVVMFFVAFLPQFVDPDLGSLAGQIFSLGCSSTSQACQSICWLPMRVASSVACLSAAHFGRAYNHGARVRS